MKRLNRPVLTVRADDDDDRDMLRTPKLTIRTSRDQHKHSTDSDSDEMDHDDPDALEASCDIGETTLRKGPIQINRSGVTFVSSEAKTPHAGDFAVPELKRDRSERATSPPIGANRRRAIALEDLESCGLLGRGCSGHVLKAQHKQSRECYAIKVVNNVYDKSKRDQLLTEIRTLYSVDSPYLVEFYGAYFKDHQLSLILEYCQVGSLDKVFQLAHTQEAWIPEPIVACLASQMLYGLYHLKQTHHFHRDIKPQNILVDRSGHVKLTDFGIARELGHSQDMAQTFVGTFKYMSPERVQNEPYDYKSDIWSLGLVLIECATKMFPFRHARSYIDVVQSIIECNEPELPPNTSELSFSNEFRVFISDCLKKDPKERASVEQLLHSPWLALHDTQHGGSQCTQRVRKWLQSLTPSEIKHSDEEDEYANDTFEESDEKS